MAYNPRLQFGYHRQRDAGRVSRTGGRTERDQNRRTRSQNFLRDGATIQRIVRASRSRSTDLVVEVGAGEGRLTAALAVTAERVVAYEIDPVVAIKLRARCDDLDNVQVVRGDFLKSPAPREPFAVVGNIPYSVTSRIVDWCLHAPRLTSATLVTQLEYAKKRTGGFGTWSKVTVLSWPELDWRMAGRIGREMFRPVPSVDSAILRLVRRESGLLPAAALPSYRRLVTLGFGGRGGSLHASLRQQHPRSLLDSAFGQARMRSDTVVGAVHPDQWVTLFRLLHEEVP
ncbi:MAG: ErmE/ErmH/ErmO/ErmR family 23S rRNA (adenine(2058)-N(6))-methyltransferase [Propionibacteriales bacterium]|nr:ErmE/ErmH/ErmO/ErmR family 23S rRNA (adenine(2058)-N(6))-methyltransferase [Propionibacteriales bacterium]